MKQGSILANVKIDNRMIIKEYSYAVFALTLYVNTDDKTKKNLRLQYPCKQRYIRNWPIQEPKARPKHQRERRKNICYQTTELQMISRVSSSFPTGGNSLTFLN